MGRNNTPLVSVIIPAFGAKRTLARTVLSLKAQTYSNWQAIVVSDDRCDYRKVLNRAGIEDSRCIFASTGSVASGPSCARNIGLKLANGTLVAPLDADDVFLPQRFATLVPLALKHGAATDNVRVVDDFSGEIISSAFRIGDGVWHLDATHFLAISVPLMPVVRVEIAGRWEEGLKFAEDIIFNVKIFDHIPSIATVRTPLRDYRVRQGSLAHSEDSAVLADTSYRYLLECLQNNQLGIKRASVRRRLFAAIIKKSRINEEFKTAYRRGMCDNFQAFIAGRASAT
tara:strand:- start:1487 stop:2341 length:855 start_codon:yes stop_codon:yes gene_type:complete